jgi:hypothetical protein
MHALRHRNRLLLLKVLRTPGGQKLLLGPKRITASQARLVLRFVPAFRPPINLDVDVPTAKIQFAQLLCPRQFDERAGARTRRHDV